MDTTTSIITVTVGLCIVGFSVVVVAGAINGILIWYPACRNKKIDALKVSGRKGKATILRVPESHQSYSRAVYRMVNIGLEIDVPGVDVYQGTRHSLSPPVFYPCLKRGRSKMCGSTRTIRAIWIRS